MQPNPPLHLHEEVALLAIRDDRGTFACSFVDHAVAAAVVAELAFERRIEVEPSKRRLVTVLDPRPSGDPVIDACLEKMASARRRARLETWIGRLARIPRLRHQVALSLCERGILRHDQDKILFLFTRQLYPEVDPAPEREIIARLEQAIFGPERELPPRTAVLVALAHATGLLREPFGKARLKARKVRLEEIVRGERIGAAARDAIAATQAAIAAATTVVVVTGS